MIAGGECLDHRHREQAPSHSLICEHIQVGSKFSLFNVVNTVKCGRGLAPDEAPKKPPTSRYRNPSLNCPGVIPVQRLNARLKLLVSANPNR